MNELIDKKAFFEKYNIVNEDFERTRLKWSDFQEIYSDYLKEVPKLEASAVYLFNSLMKTFHVHSVRYRIKDPEHVIEKIIRKKTKDPQVLISIENYKTELTDLIGLRALHLFKEEWYSIHELITSTWDLHERPTVYYREGDSVEFKTKFEEVGCETKLHPFGYRSVHYIVETKPAKRTYFAEIQVRTIFEEAWSEIDHKIRYPYEQENMLFGQFLLILNRLAGSADEMGTFIQFLKKEMQNKEESYQQAILEKDKLIQRLEQKVKELRLNEPDLKFLTDGLEQLKIPTLSFEEINLPDMSILGQIKSIEMPDLSYFHKIKTMDLPDLSFIEKSKPIKVSKIKSPKPPSSNKP